MSYAQLLSILKGGPGSGNWGHAGRPGKRGGSKPLSGIGAAMSLRTGRDAKDRQAAARVTNEASVPINEDTKAEVLSYMKKTYMSSDMKEATDYLGQLAADSDICSRVPSDIFMRILHEGRFKNQHETGTSKGTLDPGYREEAERNAFGENLNGPKAFPIYGYLATGKHGHIPDVDDYGAVKVVLEDSLKKRATLTVGDSLDNFYEKNAVGTSALKPGPEGIDDNLPEFNYMREHGSTWIPGMYIEAQIHGGVHIDDIKHIHLKENDPHKASIVQELEFQGIPYTVHSTGTDLEKL